MIGEARVRKILQRALALSSADETEAALASERAALTRFANNEIHQNVWEKDATLEVRAVFGRRVGLASGNDLSRAGVERVVSEACSLARHLPENPEFPGLPEPQPIPAVCAWDEAVARATPSQRARAVATICAHAARAGLKAAGAYSTAAAESAVANSKGLFAYHAGTDVDLTLVAQDDRGSGYAHAAGWRLAQVDPEALSLEAVERALLNRGRQPLAPGEYPVVLDSYAVLDLLEALAESGMGAQAVQEGRSWMSGRQGRALMSPALSIADDALDPDGYPTPFDCEGVPKQRVDIVQAGVAQGPVYDTRTAAREPGCRSTGHAQPYADEDWAGPLPENLCLAPGTDDVAGLLRGMGRGLYVTRFHYTNLVSEKDCGLTGTTRDGAWWVAGGELAYPVRTLRFDQKVVRALRGVRGVGKSLRTLAGNAGVHRVPALALESFRFVGGR